MTARINRKNRQVSFMFLAGIVWCVCGPAVALADPLGAGDGAIFQMTPRSFFQEGCFPPCLCPIMTEQPVVGTMKLVYTGFVDGLKTTPSRTSTGACRSSIRSAASSARGDTASAAQGRSS